MVLSEYWKRLEENFRKRLFPRFPKNDENYKKKPLALFNILKEPLLVQKQTIHQQKALDLSFQLAPWKWAWHYQEGAMFSCREKHFLLIFYGRVEVFRLFGFNDIATPSWWCHALVLQAPNSWDQELFADVTLVSVLAMVLSEYWF